MAHGPTAADFPALANFLDGYFHQDFRSLYGSAEEAAREFTRDADFGLRADVDAEFRAFRRILVAMREDEWRDALARIGGAWRPVSLQAIDAVLDVLEASLD
ncbi:MAG TPA: contact-dependent growth inhibition system immunity protein [Tepidiformaceae bacterium]|jgi:hypothetical protein|nr:hypothetical protein [Thermoflexaceae bacterium]HMS58337.1 contact-dependent growth inhibition system immunity protein [Tepidiformaceae bacterium]